VVFEAQPEIVWTFSSASDEETLLAWARVPAVFAV
jgi:hypothetical protein